MMLLCTPRNTTSNNFITLVGSTIQRSFDFEYNLHSTSTGVCVNCTFLDSSTTDCVAVVHQQISQLSSSGLMNIESSHKFNRAGDNAYGCIEGLNLTSHQIGVVGLYRSSNKLTKRILFTYIYTCRAMIACLLTRMLSPNSYFNQLYVVHTSWSLYSW